MIKEPKRLSESLDDLGASVSALRTRMPSEERLAVLAARLTAAGVSVGEPASAVVPKVPSEQRLRLVSKSGLFDAGTLAVIGALLVGGALVTAAVLIRGEDEPRVLTPGAGVVPAAPPFAAPSAIPAESTVAGESVRALPTTKSLGLPAPVGDTGASLEPPLAAPAASAHVSEGSAAEPTAAVSSRSLRRSSGSSTLAPGAPTDGAALADNTAVVSEIELLKQAKSALGADPLQAFALTERCRGQYPSGSFAQEREYIAISALSRLGRPAEARSRAALFRMHYPNSAYLPRLAPMLAEE